MRESDEDDVPSEKHKLLDMQPRRYDGDSLNQKEEKEKENNDDDEDDNEEQKETNVDEVSDWIKNNISVNAKENDDSRSLSTNSYGEIHIPNSQKRPKVK